MEFESMDRVSAGICVNAVCVCVICVDLREFGNLPSGMQVYIYIYMQLDWIWCLRVNHPG